MNLAKEITKQIKDFTVKSCKNCFSFLIYRKKKPIEYLELAEFGSINSLPPIVKNSELNENNEISINESEFLEYFNSSLHEGCEKMYDKDEILVYGKDLEEGFLVKSVWYSNYSPEELLEYSRISDERKNWDKNADYTEEIEGSSKDEYFTYIKFKKVIAISQRDMMIASNVYRKKDGIIVVSRSYDHKEFPESEGFIRMKIKLAGYYFQTLDCNKTKVFSLTIGNFGGSLPQKFIRKSTGAALPKLYQDMEKAMSKYFSSKTTKLN